MWTKIPVNSLQNLFFLIFLTFLSQIYRYSFNLTAHKLSHTERRDFSCNHCGTNFKQRFSLQRHMKQHAAQLGLDDKCVQMRKTGSKTEGFLIPEFKTEALNQNYPIIAPASALQLQQTQPQPPAPQTPLAQQQQQQQQQHHQVLQHQQQHLPPTLPPHPAQIPQLCHQYKEESKANIPIYLNAMIPDDARLPIFKSPNP